MNDHLAERLSKARAELAATREAVSRAERELRDASMTVTSRDRSVEVTVGPQGELTQLRFLDGKYKSMGAAQLAAAVLEAAQQGRAQMARRVVDTFQPLVTRHSRDPETEASAVTAGAGLGVDWDKIFGSLLSVAQPGGRSGRPVGDRLRDEMDEDGGRD
ncbi:YbaB/EbfC family nucleoid-associated protein [Streptomyces sp. NPDC098781]|uniref:YbaB/EbfC family nucleoid-associated protein n=1 Tax=Streptomyces sp. NPDC098781 TaxID=3366097 RepID=UPI00380EE432